MLLKKPSRLSSLSMLLFYLSFVLAFHLGPLTQLKLQLQQIFVFSKTTMFLHDIRISRSQSPAITY